MNYCHTCVFYNTQTGWCSAHNESHSSSGSCSKWRGGNSSRREKPKFTPFDGSGKDSKKGGKAGSGKKYKGIGCGTCIWWDRESKKCTNKNSEAHNKEMSSGALCTIYQQYPGAQLMPEERLRNYAESSFPKTDRSKPARKKNSKKSKKKEASKKTSQPKKTETTNVRNVEAKQSNVPQMTGPTVFVQEKKRRGPNDHCNRCQYYENGQCKNGMSSEYNKSKRPLNWCEAFMLCSWLRR